MKSLQCEQCGRNIFARDFVFEYIPPEDLACEYLAEDGNTHEQTSGWCCQDCASKLSGENEFNTIFTN